MECFDRYFREFMDNLENPNNSDQIKSKTICIVTPIPRNAADDLKNPKMISLK